MRPELGHSRPLYFEDLELGLSWRTAGRTITEADIVAFAAVEVHNQREEVVASGRFVTLMRRRGPAA